MPVAFLPSVLNTTVYRSMSAPCTNANKDCSIACMNHLNVDRAGDPSKNSTVIRSIANRACRQSWNIYPDVTYWDNNELRVESSVQSNNMCQNRQPIQITTIKKSACCTGGYNSKTKTCSSTNVGRPTSSSPQRSYKCKCNLGLKLHGTYAFTQTFNLSRLATDMPPVYAYTSTCSKAKNMCAVQCQNEADLILDNNNNGVWTDGLHHWSVDDAVCFHIGMEETMPQDAVLRVGVTGCNNGWKNVKTYASNVCCDTWGTAVNCFQHGVIG